jgi:hypothetical protein
MEVLLKTVFYTQSMQRGCKEDNWDNKVRFVRQSVRKKAKGGAVQRGPEPGSRRIAIVKAVTRQLLAKTLKAAKDLAGAVLIFGE